MSAVGELVLARRLAHLLAGCQKIRDHSSFCCYAVLLASILKRGAFVVANAQRGFNPPSACDKYSVVDTHSPRVSLFLYANIAFSLHLPLPRLTRYINVFNALEAKGSRTKAPQVWKRRGRGPPRLRRAPLDPCVVTTRRHR